MELVNVKLNWKKIICKFSINTMKNAIYFLIILVAFTSCKLNSNNEVASEVTETVSTAQADSVTTQQIKQIENQPKTKDEQWNEYWAKFTTAIKQKDKKTMLELALKPNEVSLDGRIFTDGGGADNAEEFINYVDNSGYWSDWLSIANNKNINITKEKNRIFIDGYMIFEFINGRWVWIGVMGD